MLHKHKWHLLAWQVVDVYFLGVGESTPDRTDTILTLVCEKCGKDKSKRFMNLTMTNAMIRYVCQTKKWETGLDTD